MTNRKLLILLHLGFIFQSGIFGVAFASHEVDTIEVSLSKDIVSRIQQHQNTSPLAKDEAYRFFLLAVYGHDQEARTEAENIYKNLQTPESAAFLGSLKMVEARDFSSNGIFQGMKDIFKKRRFVNNGINSIDNAASQNPTNLEIKIVRAISYLELPSFFGKFDTGLSEMKIILKTIEADTTLVPDNDPLFRDKSSLFYFGGRYFLSLGKEGEARQLFRKSVIVSPDSPFAVASKRRIDTLPQT